MFDLEEFGGLVEGFKSNAEAFAGGNKSAGVRARKFSVSIEKRMKEFRKMSVAVSKKPEA